MPELPEVETIVRGLAPLVRGRRVEAVWWSGQRLHLRRAVNVAGLRTVAVGRTIAGVRRLGKYAIFDLDGGPEGSGVLVHLGMTGRLRVLPATEPRAAHTHVVFRLAGREELRFSDARRFGWVEPVRALAKSATLSRLGPDPLGALDAAGLAAALRGVRAPIKAFLLDQRRIAGLGNIYVSEALFRAGVHPRTPGGRLSKRASELLAGIRAALEGGIARRGTTLRDYVGADGLPGDNAAALLVYGRAGEACPRCGSPIRRQVDGGRATFYCPRCQRR
jgi:formamidopyrimidine-DNA glycosylase